MSENQIVTISEADVKTGGQLGSRTQYLADLARRHPHRDEYGQLLEFTVAVPDGPHEFRGRRGPFPIRAEAESAADACHVARERIRGQSSPTGCGATSLAVIVESHPLA